jgi:heme o synthase
MIFGVANLVTRANLLKVNYWPLIKSRQTFLLTLTGVTGYLCQPHYPINWLVFLGLVGSLLVTVSGCSVLNMLFDQDIDRKMSRTSTRPMAAGQVNNKTALLLGCMMIAVGLAWSASLSALYFTVVLAGAGLNVLVYTLWLKRRTAWSILLGGLAGAMPILAGRTLAVGRIDPLGLYLALIILSWIPSHNLTLVSMYSSDYENADIPTFLSAYGTAATHLTVTISSLLTASTMVYVTKLLSVPAAVFTLLTASSLVLVGMAVVVWLRRAPKIIQAMYKYSSAYMLVSMALLAISGIV